MADKAEEFWDAFEKETGEKVEVRSIGEFFPVEGRDEGLWGLLVLTDKSFRFKGMPSDNWFLNVFKRKEKKDADKVSMDLCIARENIASVISPKQGFFSRIFGPNFLRFTITRSDEGGETYVFAVDPQNAFLTALKRAATH
jgi:hypothetical protein